MRLLNAAFLHHNFEYRGPQLGRLSDDQPCRSLPADVRPVRDRATLHVSCLICGVRRAGWYLPSCAAGGWAHLCGPRSLKLPPCRGNPFVDLVVTVLQILAVAKRRWRHRPLDISCRGGGLERGEGGAEVLAVSDVICSVPSTKHPTADASRGRDGRKKDGMIQESAPGRLECGMTQANADSTRRRQVLRQGVLTRRASGRCLGDLYRLRTVLSQTDPRPTGCSPASVCVVAIRHMSMTTCSFVFILPSAVCGRPIFEYASHNGLLSFQ